MKKTLLGALIAATALVPPAFAQERGGRWGGNRPAGEARPAPQQRDWNRQAPAAQPQATPQRQWNGSNRGDWSSQGAQPQREWNGGARNRWNGQDQRQQPQAERQWDGGSRGEWRRPDAPAQPLRSPRDADGRFNRDNRGDRSQGFVAPQQFRGDRDARGWGNNQRPDRRWDSGNTFRGDRGGRWDNRWRADNRYDWRGYRTQNRNLYRLPRYYAPSGWGYGYRRFSTGFQLSALLYSSQYWINDPFNYRLPEAYGPYRWVRYYNDALLVDTYSGQVVDTIYDIFW